MEIKKERNKSLFRKKLFLFYNKIIDNCSKNTEKNRRYNPNRFMKRFHLFLFLNNVKNDSHGTNNTDNPN